LPPSILPHRDGETYQYVQDQEFRNLARENVPKRELRDVFGLLSVTVSDYLDVRERWVGLNLVDGSEIKIWLEVELDGPEYLTQ